MLRRAIRFATKIANKPLGAVLGLKIIPKHHDQIIYQHDYGKGGYDKYREVQIKWNKAKIHKVWAEGETLSKIADDIKARGLARNGLCHGARNGWEVKWFKDNLGCPVIGTDISDTATGFPDMVQHDFHDVREDWVGKFSFVYSNSLDQAFDPGKAVKAWADQLEPGGCLYLEHTMQHSAAGVSEMDPSGTHPRAMPYRIFEWGKGKFALDDILEVDWIEHTKKGHVWIFVIKRLATA